MLCTIPAAAYGLVNLALSIVLAVAWRARGDRASWTANELLACRLLPAGAAARVAGVPDRRAAPRARAGRAAAPRARAARGGRGRCRCRARLAGVRRGSGVAAQLRRGRPRG